MSRAQPCLPYALAFAAGAMVFVVVDDLVPEAHAGGGSGGSGEDARHPLVAAGAMVGFAVMMSMDVAL